MYLVIILGLFIRLLVYSNQRSYLNIDYLLVGPFYSNEVLLECVYLNRQDQSNDIYIHNCSNYIVQLLSYGLAKLPQVFQIDFLLLSSLLFQVATTMLLYYFEKDISKIQYGLAYKLYWLNPANVFGYISSPIPYFIHFVITLLLLSLKYSDLKMLTYFLTLALIAFNLQFISLIPPLLFTYAYSFQNQFKYLSYSLPIFSYFVYLYFDKFCDYISYKFKSVYLIDDFSLDTSISLTWYLKILVFEEYFFYFRSLYFFQPFLFSFPLYFRLQNSKYEMVTFFLIIINKSLTYLYKND